MLTSCPVGSAVPSSCAASTADPGDSPRSCSPNNARALSGCVNSAFLNISQHFTGHLFRPWIPNSTALPTLAVLARTVSGCVNSAFLDISQHFTGHLFRPWIPSSVRGANTSCPRSDRFWLRELRVSQHFSTFYGPSVQAMDTQLNAPPTLPVLTRTVSGCVNSAFLGLFSTSCGTLGANHVSCVPVSGWPLPPRLQTRPTSRSSPDSFPLTTDNRQLTTDNRQPTTHSPCESPF